jgi:chitinase
MERLYNRMCARLRAEVGIIDDHVAAAAGAQSTSPNLQFSFKPGASAGGYGGVNSLGNEVVEAVLGSNLRNDVINLMTAGGRRAASTA